MAVAFLILGLLCLIYCIGIFVAGIYGSWFFLIWGVMGGVFVLLSRVIASGLWAEAPLILRRLVLAAVVLGILFFLFIEGLIVGCFWEKGRSGLDYLVVLGAQMWESGPSKALKLRLDAAYEYLMENENTIVIVSGGQGSNEPISEAQGMYDYLVGRGIAPVSYTHLDVYKRQEFNDAVGRGFHKLMVPAGEKRHARELNQTVVQGRNGFHIQMVGRFIQDQAIRSGDHHFGQKAAHLLTSGEDSHFFHPVFSRKEHPAQEAAHIGDIIHRRIAHQPVRDGCLLYTSRCV